MFKFFGQQSKSEELYSEYQNALSKGEKEAALYLIKRVVELDPSNKGARLEKGQLLKEMKIGREAKKAIEEMKKEREEFRSKLQQGIFKPVARYMTPKEVQKKAEEIQRLNKYSPMGEAY